LILTLIPPDGDSTTARIDTTMTIEEEPRQHQRHQSPSQSLTALLREGLNQPGSSMPRQQIPNGDSTTARIDTTMTIEEEPRQQHHHQSPSQSLMALLREGLNQPGPSMPRLQPAARMSDDEQRAHLLSTIDLALAIMSGADASVFVRPQPLVSSASSNARG
jgi:hypothetical protein